MFKYEPEANLHGFYLVKTNAVYKAIGHADFASQTDMPLVPRITGKPITTLLPST